MIALIVIFVICLFVWLFPGNMDPDVLASIMVIGLFAWVICLMVSCDSNVDEESTVKQEPTPQVETKETMTKGLCVKQGNVWVYGECLVLDK